MKSMPGDGLIPRPTLIPAAERVVVVLSLLLSCGHVVLRLRRNVPPPRVVVCEMCEQIHEVRQMSVHRV